MSPLPLYIWLLGRTDVCGPCARMQGCCEFMVAMSVSLRRKDSIVCPFLFQLLHSFHLLFHNVFLASRGCYKCLLRGEPPVSLILSTCTATCPCICPIYCCQRGFSDWGWEQPFLFAQAYIFSRNFVAVVFQGLGHFWPWCFLY